MEKYFKKFLFLFLLICASFGISSCGGSDEDYDESNALSGTWYLVTYDGNTCDWGEYMRFSGSTLYWNKRRGARNTTYTYEKTSNGFKCSNSEETYVFSIETNTGKDLVTYSSDGMVRVWRR